MVNNLASKEIREIKERLGIDEDLFYFCLYDFLTVAPMSNARKVQSYIEWCMKQGIDGDIAGWKKQLRAFALAQLERDIIAFNLPVRRTANEMARREFGVDDARWLKCWQLAKLIYLLETKGSK